MGSGRSRLARRGTHTHTHGGRIFRGAPPASFAPGGRRCSLAQPQNPAFVVTVCSAAPHRGPLYSTNTLFPTPCWFHVFDFRTRAAAPKCGPPLAGNRGAASPLHEAQLFKLFSRSLLLRSFYRLRLCWALARCRLALRGLQWVQPGTIPRTCPLFYLLCHCVAVPQNDVHPC